MHCNIAIVGKNMNSINNYLCENKKMQKYTISLFDKWSDFELNINNNIDILFINIDLECGNGVNLIKKHKNKLRDTMIIIVSKSRNFAYDAFKIGAFQYILEPINEESLKLVWNNLSQELSCIELKKRENRILTVSTKDAIYKIRYKDIYYFEKVLRKIRIINKDGVIEYYGTFKDLEYELDLEFFIQCHQSFIVNKNKIHIYKNQQIYLEEIDAVIPVSKAYVKEIRSRIT